MAELFRCFKLSALTCDVLQSSVVLYSKVVVSRIALREKIDEKINIKIKMVTYDMFRRHVSTTWLHLTTCYDDTRSL